MRRMLWPGCWALWAALAAVDDIADSGAGRPAERAAGVQAWVSALDAELAAGTSTDLVRRALADTIVRRRVAPGAGRITRWRLLAPARIKIALAWKPLLLDEVADHALGAGVQHVQRVRLGGGERLGLQRQQAYLRPLPWTTTTLCPAASGAIASAAIRMFLRSTSVVIGLPLRSSALPPSAITIFHSQPPARAGSDGGRAIWRGVTQPRVIPASGGQAQVDGPLEGLRA